LAVPSILLVWNESGYWTRIENKIRNQTDYLLMAVYSKININWLSPSKLIIITWCIAIIAAFMAPEETLRSDHAPEVFTPEGLL
jgi:hypothetical protein